MPCKSHNVTAATINQVRIVVGIPPIRPLPRKVTAALTVLMALPPAIRIRAPCRIVAVASVRINGWTRSSTTPTPFSPPIAVVSEKRQQDRQDTGRVEAEGEQRQDHRREGDDGCHGQVDATADHDQRLSCSNDAGDRGQLQEVAQMAELREARFQDARSDPQTHHDQPAQRHPMAEQRLACQASSRSRLAAIAKHDDQALHDVLRHRR